MIGTVTGVKVVDLGVALTLNSAGPYTQTIGGDPYNNGRGRARLPGVARNRLAPASRDPRPACVEGSEARSRARTAAS